ncbi:MAG: sensor histidine kinase [Verrucomicrobiales bacterium]
MGPIVENSRAHPTPSPSQGFFWQGLLILLPLLVLAAAGVWSLRGQREAIEQTARQDAAASSQVFATSARQAIEQSLRSAHPPVPLEVGQDPAPFPFLYDPNPAPPGELAAYERYLAALENPPELEAILAENPNAISATGVPLKVLILYQLFLAAAGDDGTRSDLRQRLEEAALHTHPSVLSSPILSELGSPALARWQEDEQVRTVLRRFLPLLREERRSRWAELPGGIRWRLELLPDQAVPDRLVVHALPLGQFPELRAPAGAGEFLSYALNYDGQPLGSDPGSETPATFASSGDSQVKVTAYLKDSKLLFAQQRRQVTWFLGIIAASALTGIIGLLVARHAYLKQQALNRLKSNFVSSVSHELRAPIASIRLMAERLRAGKVEESDKRREYFGFIEQESQRLANLVENVLDFSRIEDGRKSYHFAPTDIATLTTETIQLMQPSADEKGLTLEGQIQAPDREPSLDAIEIQQALINLIDNAIKYSPDGASITVGLEQTAPERIKLWVQDHGPGIPRAEQEKIFHRFYRIGSELERETQGVGIGLAIVQHTAEAHGGSIDVDSQPGAGSRFTLDLPTASK